MTAGGFFSSRRWAATAAALLVVQVVGWLISGQHLQLHEDSAFAIPWIALLPVVSASLIGVSVGSTQQELERLASRNLAAPRLLHVVSLVAVMSAGAWLLGQHVHGPFGSLAALRNGLGFVGLTLVTAVVVGSRFSWVPTTAWVCVAMTVGTSDGADSVVTWPCSPDSAPRAMTAALVLFVTGLVLVTTRHTREEAVREP